jgi:hypothetical protein
MIRSAVSFVFIASVSLATLACSSSNDETRGSGPSGLGAYPAEPYGHDIGQVMPNLQWHGYVNETAEGVATAQPFVPYSMDDVRHSGKPYAFVHVSEFY